MLSSLLEDLFAQSKICSKVNKVSETRFPSTSQTNLMKPIKNHPIKFRNSTAADATESESAIPERET